ncbi:MerR family transcriptional regulator [Fibrobacter sp. UWEL]|uniref:MerR family transcriptional regulator n=1 Tax=Fibrobacter sp. UWEL TaxID=1896209 RepID=UPI000911E8A7|nr:MerR family transcriptional regulator [Fibrobacter sp. UWEL]SHK95801.1 DNA-binding transcriptional regulator, MerR family [Fibrobacter sp. UWEL]
MGYSIGEVTEKTGLSAHTLRYYEKEGLLPFVTKSSSGIRVYADTDLQWLSMIECLKKSGLQIKEIRQYIDWYRKGDSTLKQRLDLFVKRRKAVEEEMERLNVVLNKVRFKEALYAEALKLGSLEAAHDKKEIQRLKKKLFDSPSDFDKVMQESA